jgi:hypothetical protein
VIQLILFMLFLGICLATLGDCFFITDRGSGGRLNETGRHCCAYLGAT